MEERHNEIDQMYRGWVAYWKPFKKACYEDTPRWTICATHAYEIAHERNCPPATNNQELALILNSVSDRSFENRRGVGKLTAEYRMDFIKRHR